MVRIGIDFDSTLAKIDQAWVQRLNDKLGTTFTPNDWTDWDCSFVPPEHRKLWFSLFTPDIYKDVKPYPGAQDAIMELAHMDGVELCVVTANPKENDAWTFPKWQWLCEYFPQTLADHLVVSDKKTDLVDIMVDDAPKYHHPTPVAPTMVLPVRPWNRNVECKYQFEDWATGLVTLRFLAGTEVQVRELRSRLTDSPS